MALRAKYQQIIDAASLAGVTNLQVREQDGILYIDGTAPSETVKRDLWDLYGRLDPNYRSGDLILNVNVFGTSSQPLLEYEVKPGDSLSKIGEKYGVSWKSIYEINRDLVDDPDLIQPGWKLKIPTK